MAWIESHQELRNHPKTKRLCRLLGLPCPTVVGYLHFLWWWAYDYAPEGDLSDFTDEDIADAVDWDGDPGALMGALVQAGFINDDRRLHDWEDFAQKWIERRQADRERKRARRQPAEIREMSGGCPPDIRSLSGVTVPDHTGPNLTGPMQQQAVAVSAPACADGAAAAAASEPDEPGVPAALAGFHEVLSGVQGYQPSAAFLRQVAERYGALDLTEEALKMASWLADPARNRSKRSATTRFVLNWLRKTLEDGAHQEEDGVLEADVEGASRGESLAPPTDEEQAVWQAAREALTAEMSRPNWETYIAPLTLAGRGADGGLRLRAPPMAVASCRRFGRPIARALFDAGDPGAQRVVIVEARAAGQE